MNDRALLEECRIGKTLFRVERLDSETKSKLLDSLWADRLVISSGAGLSMAHPSSVPSAPALAGQCATAYETISGNPLPDQLHWDIEALADYFAERNQLQSIFLNSVIRRVDLGVFFRNPNFGHEAIGDFLGCGAIELNISTNVDDLTERAAELLGEPKANIVQHIDDFKSCASGRDTGCH